MNRLNVHRVVLIFIVCLVTMTTGGHAPAHRDIAADYLALPVVPDLRRQELVTAIRSFPQSQSIHASTQGCALLKQMAVTDGLLAIRYASSRGMTEIYAGEFSGDRVVRYDIDANLQHAVVPLPLAYGVVWAATDLDGDGEIELVLQRGAEGNGWLDILSAPDWTLRAHLVFPGMNVQMRAIPVNVDADQHQELFATPSTIGGLGHAIIIDYEPVGDTFYVRSEVPTLEAPGGVAAIADFDQDGRMEFIKGSSEGYALYEWQGSSLSYIGKVGDSSAVNAFAAVICQPRQDQQMHVLLGHNLADGDYLFELLVPSGDNQFTLSHPFREEELAYGITPCGAADFDCDGLDELVMFFPPDSKSWEWSEDSCKYVPGCVWPGDVYGTIPYWYSLDLDQNGVAELGAATGSLLRVFSAQGPIVCDTLPVCAPPSPCSCSCHADPGGCDGLIDVVDVVQTVNVAFRGASPLEDPSPNCPYDVTDVDCSAATDVVDVVRIVNVAFRGADAASEICDPC